MAHGSARKGIALVICAPSGAGKTTLTGRLRSEFPNLSYSVSCTTRPPRDGEIQDVDYHFLSQETFLSLRDNGHFAEWASVHGNFYGTPLKALQEQFDAGKDILFDIDVQGADQLRKTVPNACFVFILPPSLDELERRLRSRGTETEESLSKRLRNARREIMQAAKFDAVIVNDDLNLAYEELRSVYAAACLRPNLRPALLAGILGA
ncbi:MAG: guanylate kinase [Desulfovibrionaceae bacterium]|nr:guanylate kinase [Desulfovibrionaceae bacterium]